MEQNTEIVTNIEPEKPPSKFAKWNFYRHVKHPDFKIASKGKWYVIAPAVIVLIGIIMFAVLNFNLGLDFTGGQTVRIEGRYLTADTFAEHRDVVSTILREEHGRNFRIWQEETNGIVSMSVQFQTIGDDENMAELTETIKSRITSHPDLTGVSVDDVGFISASASAAHIQTTFIAVFVALMGILLYMLFRFKFTSGVAALIGLMHDILVMMAMVIIFRIEINAAFIAALITVVAYSINNTLILFDRVRGLEKNNEIRESIESLTDRAVKETFTRTMNTMLTTLVPIFALIIASFPLNVPLLREFAVPIFFGLVAGTFSTIFLTTSLYVRFEKYRDAMRRRKKVATNT